MRSIVNDAINSSFHSQIHVVLLCIANVRLLLDSLAQVNAKYALSLSSARAFAPRLLQPQLHIFTGVSAPYTLYTHLICSKAKVIIQLYCIYSTYLVKQKVSYS